MPAGPLMQAGDGLIAAHVAFRNSSNAMSTWHKVEGFSTKANTFINYGFDCRQIPVKVVVTIKI